MCARVESPVWSARRAPVRRGTPAAEVVPLTPRSPFQWLGNQAWVRGMDWPGKAAFDAAPVKPWSAEGKQAGEAQAAEGLTFLRVFGAGHMVPLDQPMASLLMLDAFLKGEL